MLWTISSALMQQERQPDTAGQDRVFLSEFGLPLVHDALVDGKRRKSDSTKCLFWRAQKKTGINGQRGFYSLRKTAVTEIENINPLVTEMFLGHTEKEMKKHYAKSHFELLDEATGVMEAVVGGHSDGSC